MGRAFYALAKEGLGSIVLRPCSESFVLGHLDRYDVVLALGALFGPETLRALKPPKLPA